MFIEDANFLEEKESKKIKDFFFHPSFDWHLSLNTVEEQSNKNFIDHFQFSHVFYFDNMPKSDYFNDINNLFLKFLKKHNVVCKAILRSKSNLIIRYPGMENKILQPHIDAPFSHKVFLYYVNDSDGNTVFFDNDLKIQKEVSPLQGKGILFDGLTYHANKMPSKSDFRCVINIAFL